MIRDAVRAAWIDFNTPLEGMLPGPYVDVRGLVTVGLGNLIDPLGPEVLALPWGIDGRRATQDEIRSSWAVAKAGDPNMVAARQLLVPGNNIRLSRDAIQALVDSRLDSNARMLTARFANFADWPADAQMATLSMTWALGVAGLLSKFPRCCAAMARGDWTAASRQCRMTGGGSIPRRNALNEGLFLSAATSSDADTLHEV